MTQQASITGKEPWLAVILSSLFPGVGQIYAGQKIRGVILIISSLCLLFFIILFGLAGRLADPPVVQFGIMFFLLVIFNLFDAHRCARKANHPDFERIRKSEKDPWLAVFLSRVIPGLGYAYMGKWSRAIFFYPGNYYEFFINKIFFTWIFYCFYNITYFMRLRRLYVFKDDQNHISQINFTDDFSAFIAEIK